MKKLNALHVRRCHICGTVNQIENKLVDKCDQCGKFFAPFCFFDEMAALGLHERSEDDAGSLTNSGLTDSGLKSDAWNHPLRTQYPPLWGLTVYW